MLSNCGAQESWESLGLQGDQNNQSSRKSTWNTHWRDWCWRWSSTTLVTWWEELTHWISLMLGKTESKRRGWQSVRWLASITYLTWIWAYFRGLWKTGKTGVLQSMGWQRLRHNLAAEQQQMHDVYKREKKWLELISNLRPLLQYSFIPGYREQIRRNRVQFHPPHENWFKCIFFNGWVILHCVYVPQLSYPFICW